MSRDNQALELKKAELAKLAEIAINERAADSASIARLVVGAFASVTPPIEPPVRIELIVMNVSRTPRAESRKPGNIVLSWRKLFEIVPDATLAAAGAKEATWLIPFAALYIWSKLWRAAKEDLTDVEATILYALWKSRNAKNKVESGIGYEKTNSARLECGLPAISRDSYQKAVDRLLKLQCVEMKDGWLWLREWVRVTY